MITVQVDGDRALVAKLDAMPQKVHDALLKKISILALKLEAKVKNNLSGKVLNVVSGALRRSVFSDVQDSPTAISGIVASSGVKYAGIHEYGGTTRAHDIVPVKAQALAFMSGGKMVFAKIIHHPGSKIPARPYMLPALADMRTEIVQGMTEAVRQGLQ